MGGTNDENGDSKEENLVNRPSTSKNKSGESGESCHQLYRYNKEEIGSNSDVSASATYSETSAEVAFTCSKMTRPRRRTGRINKRRKTPLHRGRVWRPKIRRQQRKVSLLSTEAHSSREGSKICCCAYCGHTCCRTSFTKEAPMPRGIKKNRHVRKPKRVRKGRVTKIRKRNNVKSHRSKQLQSGSRSAMLSPLFISTSLKPNIEIQVDEKKTYSEVTPEMLYESIRKLTTWRQNVATCDLQAHIQRSYPVNPEPNELSVELKEKLRIACIAGGIFFHIIWSGVYFGIVQEINEDMWCLKSSIENLTSNHVTLFWKTYGDTMSPIEKERGG